MTMDKDPGNTRQNPSQTPRQNPSTQPNICYTITKKLCLCSSRCKKKDKGLNTAPGQEKAKTEDSAKKKKENKKGNNKNEIIIVLKKLKKTTAFLPKALQSPYAYEKGKKNCESCNMDKETYRSIMKSVKIIELIVDDVINKEQKDMLDKEDEQDVNKPNESGDSKGEKKISIQFEVYCQKEIDHNLKCVLVKLQKTIGDTLLQLCYCKSKKNPDDERCKKYDVSMNVLEHLKFEYTNLTNTMIRLFKMPPSKQKTLPDVCVACMKEEIADCTEILEEILKDGRNLKVTMRNDDLGKEKCCSRNYPHVHALVQERHVVLKFELPFELAPPSQADDKLRDEESEFKDAPPYDQWPADFNPEPTKDKPENEPSAASTSNKSDKSGKNLSKTSKGSGSLKSPRGSKTSKSKSSVSSEYCGCNFDNVYKKVNKPQNKYDDSLISPTWVDDKGKGKKDKKLKDDNHLINPTWIEKGNENDDNPLVNPTWVEKGNENDDNPLINPSRIETGNENDDNPLINPTWVETNDENDDNPLINSTWIETGDDNTALKSNTPSNINLDNPKPKKKDSSYSDSDDSILSMAVGSTDSFSPIKKRKQVSFIPDENKENIFYMGKTTHSVFKMVQTNPNSIFQKGLEKQEESSSISKTSSFNTEKRRESTISAVDSVVLVKNKYSISGKSKTSKQMQSSGNPFNNSPQSRIKQVLRTETNTANLESKSSGTLSKQQVSELLKDLGATKLLSVSVPAECCKNNMAVNDFKCISDLPFSASLHSLPLDQDDLNHITQAVEKLRSNENIVLIPNRDDEWEIEYVDSHKEEKEDKPEWHKAFSAKDAVSNICIEIQTDKPVTRKRIPKCPSQKEITNLPTIDEEDEEKTRKRSSSKDKSENRGLENRNRSTTSFKTELRFFTVEYPNVTNKTKSCEPDGVGTKAKSKPNLHCHYQKHLDRYFIINQQSRSMSNIEEDDTGYVSDESFNFCSSTIKTQNTESRKLNDDLSETQLDRSNKLYNISSIEKMMMLDLIYLDSNRNFNTSFSTTNASNVSKPFTNSRKTSKQGSSHGFYRENIKFTNNKVALTAGMLPNNLTKQTTDSRSKEGLTQQKQPNLSENVDSLLDNNYNGDCFFTDLDNSEESILENQSHLDVECVEYFTCNNIKCSVSKSNSHTIIETVDSKEEMSSKKLDKINENKELKNNSDEGMKSTTNNSENLNDKLLNDEQISCTPVNKETPVNILNCSTLESNEDKFLKNKTDFECLKENHISKCELKSFGSKLKTIKCSHEPKVLLDFEVKGQTLQRFSSFNHKSAHVDRQVSVKRHNLNRRNYFIIKRPIIKVKENPKSNCEMENSCGSTLKAKNNRAIKQKCLFDVDKKEQVPWQSLELNSSSNPVQNNVILKRHNLNRRSYFISKKPIIKVVENLDSFEDKTDQQQRKPSLTNRGTGFKSLKLTINKPEVKFPRITNIASTHEIPYLVVCQKNDDITNEKENSGVLKNCKNLKNTRKLVPESDLKISGKSISSNNISEKNTHKRKKFPDKNSLNVVEKMSLSNLQASVLADLPVNNNKDKNCSSTKEHKGIFYLFDVDGQPLTDSSGRPLQNMRGEILLKFDEAGLPLCDLKNNSVFDSSGRSVGEKDFDPEKSPYSAILKVIFPSGDPMVLYDFEGRPLTSKSGTMLASSVGEGLLRFGCAGNPISDFRGIPIFDINGKQVV